MKKRLISLIVVAVFCALLMPNLSACSIGVEDLAGYVASIENASAVGIGKMSVTKSSVKARASAQAGVMAVPVTLDNVSAEQTKDYLLTATETEDGYEYEKLSFTKIENSLFGEVKGEKEYVSADGTLSFFANKGFKYTVLVDGEEVFSEIEDNFAEDENKKQGVITLSGLEEGKTYVVRHRGKGKEKVLTQDEMKAHISRVYVSGNFTFVVFVGKDGVDTKFYSGNDVRFFESKNQNFGGRYNLEENHCRSFIIDNESGHVYSLDDTYIDSTYDGMVKAEYSEGNRLLYDLSVNEKDELVFTPIITNKNIWVNSFFSDKYGRKYICADFGQNGEYYDEQTNSIFYTSGVYGENKYYKNSNGEAVKVENSTIDIMVNNEWGTRSEEHQIEKFFVIEKDNSKRELTDNDNFYFIKFNDTVPWVCASVENGWVKRADSFSSKAIIDFYNYILEEKRYYAYNDAGLYHSVRYSINKYDTTDYNSTLFDDGILFTMREGNFSYCKDIWNCLKNKTEITYITILSNCEEVSTDEDKNSKRVFAKVGLNGEVYYTVKEAIVGGERTYEAVEAGSYEGNATSFTLQPLNR